VRIGYDGIVFASDIAGPDFAFTPAQWFTALGKEVVKDGAIVANPNKTWADVDAALPAQDILAFIPGTKHGTREVFDEKVIVQGCEDSGAYDAYVAASTGADDDAKKKEAHDKCMALRTDGVSVDI